MITPHTIPGVIQAQEELISHLTETLRCAQERIWDLMHSADPVLECDYEALDEINQAIKAAEARHQ